MTLELRPVSKALPEYGELERLYELSFPEDERAPLKILLRKSKRRNVDFFAYYDGGRFVGLSYQLCTEELVYLFYIAVMPELRRGGYGSAMLQALRERYPSRSIFLSMEQLDESAENYEERLHRSSFYEKNGFFRLGKRVQEGPVVFELVGTDDSVTAEKYESMMRSYMGLMWLFIRMRMLD